MNYRNRNDYHYGNRNGGQRRDNGGNRGGNVRGAYRPNSGKLKPNEQRRSNRDPHFNGVGNIELADGQRITVFMNMWDNGDGTFGIGFKDANAPRENGNYQPQGNNQGYGQRQQGNNQGYAGYSQQQPRNGGYDQYEPQQGGAMSRARPIPPVQYQNQYDDRSPPPHTDYPEAGGDYDVVYEDDRGQGGNGAPF